MAGHAVNNVYTNVGGNDEEEPYEDVSVKDEPVSAPDRQPEASNLLIESPDVYPEKKASTSRRSTIILSVLLAAVSLLAVVSITIGALKITWLEDQVVETKRELLSDVGGLDSTLQQIDYQSSNNLNRLNSVVDMKQELLSDVEGLNSTMQQIDQRSANNLNQLNSEANAKQELLLDVVGLNSTMQQIDQRSANNLNQLNSVRSRVNDLNGNLSQVRTTVNHHTANITALDNRTAEEEYDYVYNSYKSSYIRLVKISESWDYAQIHCGAAGEYLLTFSSTSEASWFRDLKAGTSDWRYSTWIGLRGYGSYYRWYGFSTSQMTSSWNLYWLSGRPYSTSSSYCGYSRTDGLWFDTKCYNKLYFFCEKR